MSNAAPLQDFAPARASFRDEVLQGLSRSQKMLPCKYFYDERGSQLFERICDLEEYYPTRTELAIMRRDAADMAELIGPGCLLIEYGSGSSLKTRLLLDHLENPAGYVPIDISREHLLRAAHELALAYPHVPVHPVCADYTGDYELPQLPQRERRRVVYFPGSTIGNFTPAQAVDFLHHVAEVCGPGGGLLIGVDLRKDAEVLERAYNDAEGVTAAFNLNLLARVNRELGADFDLRQFRHEAVFNPDESRIEMHLVSESEQTVRIGDEDVEFESGERIHTENSYKYAPESFAELAQRAGLARERLWTDLDRLFSVQYLVVPD